MPSFKSFELPTSPVPVLQVVGVKSCGLRWKEALARPLGIPVHTLKYWIAGHCPDDIEARLIVAIERMLSENHERAALLEDFSRQLKARVQ
jgi:hypothetical protein